MNLTMRLYKLIVFAILLSLLMVMIVSSGVAAPAPYADTIILNGQVITADNDDPERVIIAQAIAIQGNRIMAVGNDDDILKLQADWTEVIDAQGNSVTPGYIDTHNHLYETTTGFPWVVNYIPELLMIQVSASTPEELADTTERAIIARTAQIDPGKWVRLRLNPADIAVQILGNRITRASLDRIAPENPVFLATRGGSVLNSRAISAIEENYGNRIPGEYWMLDRETGWSGEYTEFSRCTSLDLIVGQSQDNLNKYIKGYFEVMQVNAQIGVTSYKTQINCEIGFSASNHIDRNDMMPIRMAWDHRWWLPFAENSRSKYRRMGDWLGHGSDFLFSMGSSASGIDAGGVAWCTSMVAKNADLKSREQCSAEPAGLDIDAINDSNTVPHKIRRTEHMVNLAELAAENRITNITGGHIAGDGALELLLTQYRMLMSDERLRQLRIQSDHCHSVTPEQIQVAARLGLTFSCDATEVPTQVIKSAYSDEYLAWNAPVASMLAAGVNTIISEFSIQRELRESPFEDGVEWLTRKINGETWGVPEEAVPDKMTLLLMMTRWGTIPLWKEHSLGSIETGKIADIVILNGDYLTVPVEQLDQLKPLLTMIDGRVAYEAAELRGNSFYFDTNRAEWVFEMNTHTDLWRWTTAPQIPPFLNGANGL